MYQQADKMCRLSDYLRHRPRQQAKVMDHECQLAFLNWVAYPPTSNNGRPYGHLSCPLTGCEKNDLGDFISYLQHVAECPFLPGATYRCPYCNRDECFAVRALRYDKTIKDHKYGKDSKVRDAVVSFFKHFGRKKDLRHKHELQADTSIYRGRSELSSPEFIDDHELQADTLIYKGRSELSSPQFIDEKAAIDWPYEPQISYLASTYESGPTPEICTMNYRGSYVPILSELPTEWPVARRLSLLGTPRLTPKTRATPGHGILCQRSELLGAVSFGPGVEMSGTRSYVHPSDRSDSDNHHVPTGHASASSQMSETWSEKGQESPHSAIMSPEPLRYYGSKSHSYHQRYTSNDSITDMEYCDSEQRCGKVSGTSHVGSPKHTSFPSGSESGMLQEQSGYGSMTPRSHLDLRLDIPQVVPGTTEVPPLIAEALPNPSAAVLIRQEVGRNLPHGDDKQNSMEELFQIGNSLEYLWARKLKASPELSIITSHLHSAPALQGGLGVLRQLFESNIDVPRTMEHLFQFMHIAYACAYKSYSTDSWYPWKALYEDVLRWSQVIEKPEDRDVYLQVADLLWSAPENMTPSMNVYQFQDRGSSPNTVVFENGFASHNSETKDTLSASQQRPIPFDIPFEEAYERLVVLEQLKNGDVVKSCTRYLDGM